MNSSVSIETYRRERKREQNLHTKGRWTEHLKTDAERTDEICIALDARGVGHHARGVSYPLFTFVWGHMAIELVDHPHYLHAMMCRVPRTKKDLVTLTQLKIIRLKKVDEELIPTIVPKSERQRLQYREFISYGDRFHAVAQILGYATRANRKIESEEVV